MATKTILIADDDSDLADVLAMRCRLLGLRVFVAYDGLTALALIDEQSPDLVCLDVNMPFGGGLDVCEMLASDEALASIPVVMLTGRSDEETIGRCRSMGAHYVLKSRDAWHRIEPLIQRLLQARPRGPTRRMGRIDRSGGHAASDSFSHSPNRSTDVGARSNCSGESRL